MEQLKKRAANLLSVKSIVTLSMTLIFCILALRGTITGREFVSLFLMVISFYFGTQSQKSRDLLDGGGK